MSEQSRQPPKNIIPINQRFTPNVFGHNSLVVSSLETRV